MRQRPSEQPFDQRHDNVAAVQHRHREEINDSEVDVQQHQEAQGQPPIRVHVGRQHGENARRTAEVLQANAGLLGVSQRRERANRAVQDGADLDPGGMCSMW